MTKIAHIPPKKGKARPFFIPMIEDANKYFFYIRPRRFGKSLTISMLHHYYDVRDKANFEKWYGGLYRREQLFAYLLDTYHENDLSFDSYQKDELASRLAYLGEWHPNFGYIAELKYAKGKESDEAVEKLRQAGIAQATGSRDSMRFP